MLIAGRFDFLKILIVFYSGTKQVLRIMSGGERGVKTLGRPPRNSYRLLRYKCAKVLPAEINGHGIF